MGEDDSRSLDTHLSLIVQVDIDNHGMLDAPDPEMVNAGLHHGLLVMTFPDDIPTPTADEPALFCLGDEYHLTEFLRLQHFLLHISISY